jgi:hypothetical protein
MKKLRKSILSIVLVMAMIVVAVPIGMMSASAAEIEVSIEGKTHLQIGQAIHDACTTQGAAGGGVVEVFGYEVGNDIIRFSIPANVTVMWYARYTASGENLSALDIMHSEGKFVIANGGFINVSGKNAAAILARFTANVTVDKGGSITATGVSSRGIITQKGLVEVNGGTVQADGSAIVVYDDASAIIRSGLVKGGEHALFVWGGTTSPALAVYYAGTVDGPKHVELDDGFATGAIYKVTYSLILKSWAATLRGTELVAGGANSIVWIVSGDKPQLRVVFSSRTEQFVWGEYTDRLPGDANNDGVVTTVDAVAVLRYAIGGGTAGTFNAMNANCDGVAGVSVNDALRILCWFARTTDRPELLM